MKIGFALWPATASGRCCRVLTAVLAAAKAARGFSQTTRGSTTRSTEIDFEAAAAENHERDAENREKTRPLQNREKTDLVKMQEGGASAAASQQQLQLLRRSEPEQSTATTLTETTTSNRQWCFYGNIDLSDDTETGTAGKDKLKSSLNGARCCGDKAVVEAAAQANPGGSWTTFPNEPGQGIVSPDGQIDCTAGSSCNADKRVTYEEAVTACEEKSRRLCYVEELLMQRADGKSLCSDVTPYQKCDKNYIWSGGHRPAAETTPAPAPAPVAANMAGGGETTESTTTTAAAEEKKDSTLLIAGAVLALLVHF